MASFVKSVTFDCSDALVLAAFWAEALGSNVDEDSTADRAWVEPPGWGGPNLWFQRVPEGKTAKNRQHFDLRAMGSVEAEVERLVALGGSVLRDGDGEDLVVMADPEGNEFCVEP
jgi:predicted enzyme related to lactoylglutathione lyase